MSLFLRYSLPLIVTGLVLGLVLRRLLGRRHVGTALAVAITLPVVLHAGANILFATGRADVGGVVTLFSILVLLLLGLALWLGLRLVARRPLWAFILPPAATAVYLLIRYFALVVPLERESVRFDLIPTLLLAGTVVFVAAALLTYTPRLPQLRRPDLVRWIRRR